MSGKEMNKQQAKTHKFYAVGQGLYWLKGKKAIEILKIIVTSLIIRTQIKES